MTSMKYVGNDMKLLWIEEDFQDIAKGLEGEGEKNVGKGEEGIRKKWSGRGESDKEV